jgi:DNA-binding NarL/FixJ family response regulator
VISDPMVALAKYAPMTAAIFLAVAFLFFVIVMTPRGISRFVKTDKLVVIDDDPDVRRGLKRLVEERTSFKVVGEAHDGLVGVQVVDSVVPDVVVIDVHLPQIDGIEATRRIKQLYPDIAVIGYSSGDHDATGSIMRGAGAEAALVKGDAPERIVATINSFARAGRSRP